MFIHIKLAILTVLMTTGMEMASVGGQNCYFNYERMMPRVTTDLTSDQIKSIKELTKELEGRPCHEVAIWGSTMIDFYAQKFSTEQKH